MSYPNSDFSPLGGPRKIKQYSVNTSSSFRTLNSGHGGADVIPRSMTGFTPPRNNSRATSSALPSIEDVYHSAFYEMAPFLQQRVMRYCESLGSFRFVEARTDIFQPMPEVWSPLNKLSMLLNVDPRQIRQVPRRSRHGKLLRMSRKMFWQQISTPLALFAECERVYYGMNYLNNLEDDTLHKKYVEVRERLAAVCTCSRVW